MKSAGRNAAVGHAWPGGDGAGGRTGEGELLTGWHEVPSTTGACVYERVNAVADAAGFDFRPETSSSDYHARGPASFDPTGKSNSVDGTAGLSAAVRRKDRMMLHLNSNNGRGRAEGCDI
jgi:hypothetical protein